MKFHTLVAVLPFVMALLAVSPSIAQTDTPPSVLPEPGTSRTTLLNGVTVSQARFQNVQLSIRADVRKQTAFGNSEIDFVASENGFPFFLLEAVIDSVKLDGERVSITRMKAPGTRGTRLIIAEKNLIGGTSHHLQIQYEILDKNISFTQGGVGLLTANADLMIGHFLELYAPTTYEDNPYAMTLELKVTGAQTKHHLFTNGKVADLGSNHWRVEFPDWYNSTAFYFHVTDQNLIVRRTVYQGLTHNIPITVYSASSEKVTRALSLLEKYFPELERDYGPFAHQTFTAYLSGGGGMEYAGAAITSPEALGHELTHSWFGRGVLPSDGRSGWIDEAMASWRDYDYFRTEWPSQRRSINLANFSPFERFTPKNCYIDGRTLLSEVDALSAKRGGAKPFLREWFKRYQRHPITTATFQDFLEKQTGISMKQYFTHYVYGDWRKPQREIPEDLGLAWGHPPTLTNEEIQTLR